MDIMASDPDRGVAAMFPGADTVMDTIMDMDIDMDMVTVMVMDMVIFMVMVMVMVVVILMVVVVVMAMVLLMVMVLGTGMVPIILASINLAPITCRGQCVKARSFFGSGACRGPWRRARHARETGRGLSHFLCAPTEIVDITVEDTSTDTDTEMATRVVNMSVE